jgi:hypothetical protein
MLSNRFWAPLFLCSFAFTASTAIAQPPTIGNCTVLPADNIWNTPIDQLPVSPNSATWVGTIGSASPLHPDFGSDPSNGMPYVLVSGSQIKYPATFTYADQSDPGPYAIPLNAPLEQGSDHHAIAIDTDNCILYEMWEASPLAASWSAGSGAIYNLTSDALRPAGWTSADAAGLPVFPGLVRYDEVAAGAINHALRFTVPQTQNTYVWPARHFASSLTGSQYPPMGARFRLRADFDISGYSAANQVILTALKKYGMMIADNGTSWFIQGVTDPRWNDSDLHNLTQLSGTDFEAVDATGLMIDPNSGQATQAGVTVTVSPATASVQTRGTQQFSATVSGSSTQTVTWGVNGVSGGNATVGTIRSGGLYTAPATAPSGGTVTVQATSTASTSSIGTATVTITTPATAPVLGSLSPASGTQGTSVGVTLTGSGFTSGSTISVGGSGVTVGGVSVVSATQITATFAIAASATTGGHSVTVSSSAGTSGAQTFTVNAAATTGAAPTLRGISPSVARQGSTVSVTLTGTGFTSGSALAISGSSVTASKVRVVNSTTITASITAGPRAAHQTHTVQVTNSHGTSNGVSFTVN